MNSNELYEEFLSYCKEYENDLFGIVIKNGETCLKITKPHNPEKNNYLIYEIIEKSRISGSVSSVEQLLDLCEETFGENFINDKNYYGYGKRR